MMDANPAAPIVREVHSAVTRRQGFVLMVARKEGMEKNVTLSVPISTALYLSATFKIVMSVKNRQTPPRNAKNVKPDIILIKENAGRVVLTV